MIYPLVSVIMPCYNAGRYLSEAIESVKLQSYLNWELIVIDDASNDNSFNIARSYAENDQRIIIQKLAKNEGIANARNQGIKIAKGDFIAFLDSDDKWKPSKLTTQMSFMKRNNYPITHTAFEKIDATNLVVAKKIMISNSVDYNELLKHNQMACSTVMYNAKQLGKSYFIKVGHEDFAYWLNMLKKHGKSFGLNDILVSYRVHTNSISSNKLKAATFTWRIYRKVEKLTILSSVYYFLNYAISSGIKYLKK
jgi:hypothetical protein